MATSTITIPSSRIYLDVLGEEDIAAIRQTLFLFNRCKEEAYNRRYDKKLLGSDMENEIAHLKDWLHKKFALRPQEYHITSVMSTVNGMIKSQQELAKLHEQERKSRIARMEDKLKSMEKELGIMDKAKLSLIERSKQIKRNGIDERTAPFIAVEVPEAIRRKRGYRRLFKKGPATNGQVYLYEVWLDKERKALSGRMRLIEEKLRLAKEKVAKHLPPVKMTFGGGKRLYRSKDTTDVSMEEWHRRRDEKRFKSAVFCGRYDSKHKNWLCHYNPESHILEMSMMNGHVVRLEDIRFPYREDDLLAVLSHPKEKGWSVCYTMELHKDRFGKEYLIVKAAFDTHPERLNEYMENGVVSVDLNLDNISWAELDGEGHRLRGGMVRFDLSEKTSHQASDILGRACSRIVRLCVDAKKPLVMENIDLKEKKSSLAYGRKCVNRGTSMFAYQKMTNLLISKAHRNGIGVTIIHPAYTSHIAKLKYLHHLRCPLHMAAAYVIGRRGMGLAERLPSIYQKALPKSKRRSHHWKQFAHFYSAGKGIRAEVFYRTLPEFKNIKEFREIATGA